MERKPSKIVRSVQPQRMARRRFLRGVLASGATVALATPALDIMLNDNGTAHADGSSLPVRFGVFYWGNGVIHDEWVPSQTGASWDLPRALAGVSPELKPYVTQVTGTSHRSAPPGHIPWRGLSLSSSHNPEYVPADAGPGYRNQNMPEPSIDQLVAEQYGELANWIGIGICRRGPYKSRVSWVRGGGRREHYPEPARVYDRLFSAVMPAPDPIEDPLGDAQRQIRASMLDAVLEDARSLRRRVGAVDQRRIDEHLNTLAELRRSITGLGGDGGGTVSPSCTAPDGPSVTDFGDGGTHEEKQAKHDLMRRMLAVGLACDVTRVFSYEWSANQSEAVYWEVGATGQHHDLSHSDPGGMRRVVRFIMDRYAELGESLRTTAEGDGNLLDNTLILGTSEHANAASHNGNDFPLLFMGRAGGAFNAGQHYRDPTNGSNGNAPKVLLTACHAVGARVASLGHDSLGSVPDRVATETVDALLL